MRKQISILLGAGFSVDAGYPLAQQLSNDVEEAIVKKEQLTLSYDPSVEITYVIYRIFKTLQYRFNYEYFYDFACIHDLTIPEVFPLITEAKHKETELTQDVELKHFNLRDYMNQIIFNCLEQHSRKKQHISKYHNFISFIEHCRDSEHSINVHTLNHDLLLEELLDIKGIKYADGFTVQEDNVNCIKYYIGSYGYPSKSNPAYVFTDDFKSSAVKVYKLHGSLDRHYIACESQNTYKQKETLDSNWKSVKVNGISNKVVFLKGCDTLTPESVTPDFLSGTNTKQEFYKLTPYKELFEHFEENIKCADILIIIGYSFCDEGINDKIKMLPQKSIVIAACKGSNMKAKEIFPKHDIWEFEDLIGIDFSTIKSKLS